MVLKSLNKKINSLLGNLMIGLEYIFKRSGPMTMGASQLCMFAKSDPSLRTTRFTMACSTNEHGYIGSY